MFQAVHIPLARRLVRLTAIAATAAVTARAPDDPVA
jgi:hypothetical protein